MSCAVMPDLRAAGETHVGCVRRHNEDNFCYVSLYPGYMLAAVTDGVGGHVGGEVASYLCCHRLMLDWKKLFRLNPDPADEILAGFLSNSLQRANLDIWSANYEHNNKLPMCTTAAVAVFTPRMVIVAHVGDSRVYCWRNNTCRLLTNDHTLQNELAEKGITDPQCMPGSHIISRAVGGGFVLKTEIHCYFRSSEDRYLLCTDGLTNCWSDEEIGNALMHATDPRNATDRFIRGALRKGAGDNVTVLCVFPEKNF